LFYIGRIVIELELKVKGDKMNGFFSTEQNIAIAFAIAL
jgi:hypothetical protein